MNAYIKSSLIALVGLSVAQGANAALLTAFDTIKPTGGLNLNAVNLSQSKADFDASGSLTVPVSAFFASSGFRFDNRASGMMFDGSSTGRALAVTIHLPDNVATISIGSPLKFGATFYNETLMNESSDTGGAAGGLINNLYIFHIDKLKQQGLLDGTGRFSIIITAFRNDQTFQINMTDANGNPVVEKGEPLNPFAIADQGKPQDVPKPAGTVYGYKCYGYDGANAQTSLKEPIAAESFRVVNKPLDVLKKRGTKHWLDCRAGLIVKQAGEVQLFGWHAAQDYQQRFDAFAGNQELTRPSMYSPFFVFFAPKPGIYPLDLIIEGDGSTGLYIKKPEDASLRPVVTDDFIIRAQQGDPADPAQPAATSPAPTATTQPTAPQVKEGGASAASAGTAPATVTCECPVAAVVNGGSIKSCTCKMN